RVATSLLGVSCLFDAGVLWGEHPPAPRWWLLDTEWWFIGGGGYVTTTRISGRIARAWPMSSSPSPGDYTRATPLVHCLATHSSASRRISAQHSGAARIA